MNEQIMQMLAAMSGGQNNFLGGQGGGIGEIEQKRFNRIVTNNFQQPETQSQLGSLLKGYMSQQMTAPGGSSAMDLSSYSVDPSIGRMKDGGIAGNTEPVTGNPNPNSPGEALATNLGMDLNTYRRYRNVVGFHESGGTMNPAIRQKLNSGGSGKGHGIFQFEPDSASLAAEKLKRYYSQIGKEPPSFVGEILNSKVPDATKLSAQDQEMLFLGQMLASDSNKKVALYPEFTKGISDDTELAEVWFKRHNKSSDGVKDKRIKKFLADTSRMGNQPITTFDNPVQEGAQNTELQMYDQIRVPAESTSVSTPLQIMDFMNGGVAGLNPRYLNIPQDGFDVPLFKEGGYIDPEKLFLGKLFREAKKGVKKATNFVGEGIKGSADYMLSNFGMGNVIQNSVVDNSKFLSGLSGIVSKVAPMALNAVIPGAGTALSTIGGAINPADKNLQQTQQFNPSAFGYQGGQYSPQGTYGGNYGANMFGNFSQGLLNFARPQRTFRDGGFVVDNEGIAEVVPEGLIPVQTEKYKGVFEKIIFPDGMIADVNATTTHEKMDDEDVTDVIPVGSYVASARKDAALSIEDLMDIRIGYKSMKYEEHSKGMIPDLITAADVLSPQQRKKKKVIAADYAEAIKNKYEVYDKDDVFARATNTENMQSRVPYLQALVKLGEEKRQTLQPDNVTQFRYGGEVKKLPWGELLSTAATALPFVSSLFGGTNQGVDRQAELMASGALPMYSLGVNQNINSQRGALGNALTNLQGLTGDLQGLNNAGTMVGIGGQLMQDTDLPELTQDFSRLENFNTSTPQSFIDAAATPTIDVNSVLDRMGGRGGSSFLANSMAQQMQSRNDAATQAFQRQQGMDLNIANTLTQGYNNQEQYNNQLRQQEIGARNNVFNNIAGQMQGNFQNKGNILSNAFSTGSQLDLQRAMLDGQVDMQNAQMMMNAAGMRMAQQGQATGGRQGGLLESLFGGGSADSSGFLNNLSSMSDSVGGMFQQGIPTSTPGQLFGQDMSLMGSGVGTLNGPINYNPLMGNFTPGAPASSAYSTIPGFSGDIFGGG